MSRPRRRPANTGNARKAGNARKGGNNRNARKGGNSRSNRNGRNNRSARTPVDILWQNTEDQPRTAAKIRPTSDPAALPRSLGEPPLAADTAAPHHLAVVYEEAVRTATALAAANGLLEEDDD